MPARTLFEKVWEAHVLARHEDGTDLIYIDRHLVHEVSSPQAFDGLRLSGRRVRRPDRTLAVPDHNVPTTPDRLTRIENAAARTQLRALEQNISEFAIPSFALDDIRQGVVHVVGPEQGLTQPGMTIVCGDSHTATHGAFGAVAFGIGTSQVEHVLATQTLAIKRPRSMRVLLEGERPWWISAKDLIMAIVGRVGTAGGAGHIIEYAGPAIRALSMEERMTVCNMTIEAGARAGMIAPDETTFKYLQGRPLAPPPEHWDEAVSYWSSLHTDPGAHYDRELVFDISNLEPQVTWGTSPEQVLAIGDRVPDPETVTDPLARETLRRSLSYMGLTPGMSMSDVAIQHVFLGSCTNGRIEDLRSAAAVVRGRSVAPGVRALVVPGSGLVKRQAEAEGLDQVFQDAGWEWREAGCSMCVALNPDKVGPGERCASTSNRNFEGRQGPGSRTHLVSPAVAAAAACTGRLIDPRQLTGNGVS